jgi:peptidoglycan/LPS O-acetylase OafA/YrhL
MPHAGFTTAQCSGFQIGAAIVLVLGMHLGLEKGLLVPPMAVLILTTWEDRGLLAVALNKRVFLWLGTLSYSVYMLHIPVRAYGYHLWPKLTAGLGMEADLSKTIFVISLVLATLAVSHVVYHRFEVPARSYIRQRARQRGA